jgi:hypothetical protein
MRPNHGQAQMPARKANPELIKDNNESGQECRLN